LRSGRDAGASPNAGDSANPVKTKAVVGPVGVPRTGDSGGIGGFGRADGEVVDGNAFIKFGGGCALTFSSVFITVFLL
jgi:hypothetical protein